MRQKIKNEDSRPLNQTQPTSVNSSCHKGKRAEKIVEKYFSPRFRNFQTRQAKSKK